MKKIYLCCLIAAATFLFESGLKAQVIISQYYEGVGTNKWIELTNMGTTSVNTASPQLKLGIWIGSGTNGNIKFTGSATASFNLNVVIPAKGTVLIGNTGNGTEVPYLTAASAAQTSNTVIKFDGNDGIALLNSSNVIVDQFGLGINATDVSYVRNASVVAPSASFTASQWTLTSLATVQTAAANSANRLGFHNLPLCTAPSAQPSSLLFGTVTSSSIAGSFSSTATADEYLVIRSNSSSLTANPLDGTVYNSGNAMGNGSVVYRGTATNFSATGLSSETSYYFFVFALKSTSCSGGPIYLVASPLSANIATSLPACASPVTQPNGLSFSTVTSSSIAGSFSPSATADEYLVVNSISASLSSNPIDGNVYNNGNAIGGGSVVYRGTATNFSASGLTSGTNYYFFVYAIKSSACTGGPKYLTSTPLSGNMTTSLPACVTPSAQPTDLVFGTVTSSGIAGSFSSSASADEYLVISSNNASLSSNPTDGTVYNNGNAMGGGSVIYRGASTNFSATGLNSSTTYNFFVFAIKNNSCTGGPKYLTSTPLSGNITTSLPTCVTPSAQPSGLIFGTVTNSSIAGSFSSSATADEYLLVSSNSASLTSNPLDGTIYYSGNTIGGGSVVYRGTSLDFSSAGLNSGTAYYFFVFAIKNNTCIGGPKYLTANPLSGSISTSLPECVSPATQPTNFMFSAVTHNSISGYFTGSGADETLVVMSLNTLTAGPINGTAYNSGDLLGGGVVIARGTSVSFNASGLTSNTSYSFYAFSINKNSCQGGPVYLSANPLTASQTTVNPPCVAATSQPTGFSSSATVNSINGSFTLAANTDGYLVIMSNNNSLSTSPANGNSYANGNSIGGGTVINQGNSNLFSVSNLNSNTAYYFFIYSYNNINCTGGPVYSMAAPLTGSQTTNLPACTRPVSQPTALIFSAPASASISGSFTATNSDEYLVLMSTSPSLTVLPADGSIYIATNTIGNAIVIQRNATTNFNVTGLISSTSYYFFVFALNSNCQNGPLYLTGSPLSGMQITAPEESTVLNFYNGNLHSHSSYSDGNADNTSRIPADNYAFAKNSMCMDFLGISEHNHATAGMLIGDWQKGIDQANSATTGNFVALHGMEWGVIGTQGASGSKAGHMIVYGIDSLIGWETNNYQIYVPKSSYTGPTGLFSIINRHGGNALAYCAHPDNYDYNNLLNTSFDIDADNAIVGTAVESGPAFSTDTTYTNPSSLSYFAFYKNMLAKGYHLGPTVDHDNHNFTFGRTAKSRLVILASSLSENNLLNAMRKLRFYASEDCGAKINFTINTQPLGSILRKAGVPSISVNTITTAPVSSIKLMYGVPGSGTSATTLTSTTASSLNYTHNALANLATGYYFLDITETNGARIITAPIWYTRDDQAARPAPAVSFFTVNDLDRVTLKWVTINESLNATFEISRSTDGRNYYSLGEVNGSGPSDINRNYAIADLNPVNGIAYYRLTLRDAAGNVKNSDIQVVDRGTKLSNYFTVYPNPFRGLLSVNINATQNQITKIELFDMAGRKVAIRRLTLTKGEQNIQIDMSQLNTGSYIIKLRLGNDLLTQMVNKF